MCIRNNLLSTQFKIPLKIEKQCDYFERVKHLNKRPKRLNGHLSIRVLSEEVIFAYQLPHHRINKNQQWQRKAALYPLNTIAINVRYNDREEDNAYSL